MSSKKLSPRVAGHGPGSFDRRIADYVAKRKTGAGVSDVAEKFGITKPYASAVLRRLAKKGDLVMGGERRFARYGATAQVAEAASLRARDLATKTR